VACSKRHQEGHGSTTVDEQTHDAKEGTATTSAAEAEGGENVSHDSALEGLAKSTEMHALLERSPGLRQQLREMMEVAQRPARQGHGHGHGQSGGESRGLRGRGSARGRNGSGGRDTRGPWRAAEGGRGGEEAALSMIRAARTEEERQDHHDGEGLNAFIKLVNKQYEAGTKE